MVDSGAPQLPAGVEAVLDVVDAIPAGKVMSYGDVAEAVGGMGPRQVGRVMSQYGALTHWWRVIRADGSLPQGHEDHAARLLDAEGVCWHPRRTVGDTGPPRVQMCHSRFVS